MELKNNTLHQQLINKQRLLQSQEQETSFIMQVKTESKDGVETQDGVEMTLMKTDIPAEVQALRDIKDRFVRCYCYYFYGQTKLNEFRRKRNKVS